MLAANVTVSIDTYGPRAAPQPPADLAVTGLPVAMLLFTAVVLVVVGMALIVASKERGKLRA